MNAPLPAQALDAEESILGALMLSHHAVDACIEILEGREFYRMSHGVIYRAIVSMYAKNVPIDCITVVEELEKTGKLDAAGGAERIHEIGGLVPSASNAKHYANIVRETWLAREMVRAGSEIVRLGQERPGSGEELIALADEEMIRVQGLLDRKSDTVYTGKQLMERLRNKVANPEDESAGVAVPFGEKLHRLKPRLYVLGGYLKHGKTAMSLQFLRAACEGGARVGFCSIEMTKDDLAERLISTFGIPHRQVMTGRIDAVYREKFEAATKEVEGWDFEVIDDADLTASAIKRAQRKGKYDFLQIDHLHRIAITDHRHERQELDDSVRQFANLARDVPVLLLSQLTPGPAHDPYPRPSISSLRATRSIGMEAATVWFVWRKSDEFHNPGTDAELICALNRFGDIGVEPLSFNRRFVRFDQPAISSSFSPN